MGRQRHIVDKKAAANAQLMHMDLNPTCPKYDIGEREAASEASGRHMSL